jgi:transcription antitermination factor NusG
MAEACPIRDAQPVGCHASSGSADFWYAIYVRNRHEKLVNSLLSQKGYETLLPSYRDRRKWSDRIKEVELPLFPGYLFCRLDPVRTLPIVSTPGVVSIVARGKTPVAVDPDEMTALQRLLASEAGARPWDFVSAGEWVAIQSGPLAGLEGIVVCEKKTLRLVLSVTLLQRSVMVELDRQAVRPIRKLRAADTDKQVKRE